MPQLLNIASNINLTNFLWALAQLKAPFIVISFGLFFLIIILFLTNGWLQKRYLENVVEFTSYHPLGLSKAYKQWSKIKNRITTKSEAEFKLAVLEADNLLGEALEEAGFKGDSVGDKLKGAPIGAFTDQKEVWKAHDIRSNVVHDPDYQLSSDEAAMALDIYEKALRDLEAF